ncbi:peptidoglycan/xylan/chitin deacetylase (PgdA/CDA1 family) [Salirhabdus euzebyi]|uniref:Peptidoglycan/xylan/chitin deacetylase (PgdA/CDA1 family) n=1 Tax=Salirhabdus euzebyi TaxID=394506 RepID=A0A841PXU7_9BACI|nr:polysaccharide deacetylase family protein [Salirhabdus euzebyi]MBB6452346.1 peptidoglycan/xylan/chitin deacetylase (PgdA/CDA1 family) [Salirhabdus euzebyi]
MRILVIGCLLLMFGCSHSVESSYIVEKAANHNEKYLSTVPVLLKHKHVKDFSRFTEKHVKNFILSKYEAPNYLPVEWGETVTGVKTQLNTTEKVIALTLDACGGPYGSEYDKELLDYLITQHIPATLFVNSRWINENPELFLALYNNPLFSIANHGTHHKPLSINGNTAWGIKGTTSIAEVVEEVLVNNQLIEQMTGETPKYFRSGTAFYDDVSVQIVEDLGMEVVNYSILGDAGATYSKEQVKHALLNSHAGSIALLHMNQPHSETAEGVKLAIPILIKEGFRFAKLDEFPLK